jgi:hypothetical protein
MAHHKRRRPKAARAGCKQCKPHKFRGSTERARRIRERDLEIREQNDVLVNSSAELTCST